MPTKSSGRAPQTYQLSDGRMLGYAEYGAPQGKPLFYFHGWPSSRIEFAGLNSEVLPRRRAYFADPHTQAA
jgi:hypothetical protein